MEQLLCGQQLGVDRHGQVKLLPQKAKRLVIVLGVPDAGNGVPRALTLGQKAHQHVQLVRAGYGNKKVGLVYAGLLQGLAIRAVAVHAHDVILIAQLVQNQLSVVHGYHVVALGNQGAEQGNADFAAAHKNDPH